MKTSLNPLMYRLSKKWDYIQVSAIEEQLKLKPGHYYVAGRSGGGAGSSGAGGTGGFFENDFEISTSMTTTVSVGQAGKTVPEGGNGGDYDLFYPQYTFSIDPTPSDSTVTLIAYGIVRPTVLEDMGQTQDSGIIEEIDGGTNFNQSNYDDMGIFTYQQTGNSIVVAEGTRVSYAISKQNYDTKTGEQRVYADTLLTGEDATIYLTKRKLIVNYTPYDATITFSTGTVSGNTCIVPHGTSVTYTVSRTGYATKSHTTTVTEDNQTETIDLVKNNYTLTINPTPADATVTLTAAGYVQSGNSITVPYETAVSYSVSRTGYATQTGSYTLGAADHTVNVLLVKNNYTLTINPTPNDATVTLTAADYTQSGNSITVPYETSVAYSVAKTGYATQTGTETVTSTHTTAVSLTKNNYTLTVNTTPGDATVNFSTGTVSGHNCTVPYETTVSYTISKTGYITSQTYTKTVTQDESITAPALVLDLVTLTINPTPSTATVTLAAQGYTQSGNSISVAPNTRVSYVVSNTGYVSQSDTITVTQTNTLSITLNQITPTLITSSQTKTLSAGRYKAILISAGGDGALGSRASVSSSGAPGGGGGGSGKVAIVEFVTGGESITFSPATTSGGTTSITGSVLGAIGSITGGSTASGATGANGGNGGGGASNSIAGGTPDAGGAGGTGGHDGYSSSYAGGSGVNGTSAGGSANNGASAGTSSLGNAGSYGQGAVSIQSTLLSISGFNSATVNSILNAMAGGGAGSGGKSSRAATLTGGPGGGGGGWFNGTSGSAGALESQSAGTGGKGAIIYMPLEQSIDTLDGGLVTESVSSSTDIGLVTDSTVTVVSDKGLL